MPPGLAAKSKGTVIRAATFNVRTAKATWDKRHWMKRRGLVAAEIKASRADVVAIQEMSPGRQDGKDGSTKKVGRQTTSLVTEMKKIGLGHYKLVRESQYKKPGTVHGTQGTRILYNTRKYELLSNCPEKTGKKWWNPACSIDLPIMKTDSGKAKRKAAYAAFEDRSTGKRFYVVSAHLDQRHSKSLATEKKYNALRDAQTKTILDRIDSINTRNRPVIFGGDINSWQNNIAGDAPRDRLIANGYYDTIAATRQINVEFPTINHYKPVLERSSTGVGTRIDILAVQGSQGSNLYWNKTLERDTQRPSDHNLVAADIVL
jgi:endonuclease/exonuclease/phosphatase family metal-dependent hydrolase